jgi:murein DD-endopeptidase MepM/ murein hydrolase activator NlpD
MPIIKWECGMTKRILIASIIIVTLFGVPVVLCSAEQEYHVIQTGETLYSIAKSYAIPYDLLATTNGITDPSKIRPGIVLLIPKTHTVGKGETFYGISKKYDISIQDLKNINSLSEQYVLKVGDVLLIPEKGNSTSVSAAPASPPPVPSAAKTAPQNQSQELVNPADPPLAMQPPPQISNPPAEKPTVRTIDSLVKWPVEGKCQYMSGKLEGVMFQASKGSSVNAVASGTVVSAGPSRGFGEVVFVQSKSGFVYVYGGNETVLVKTGEIVEIGKTIAKVGIDGKEGSPIAYFFVFRNGQPVDPSLAPRE